MGRRDEELRTEPGADPGAAGARAAAAGELLMGSVLGGGDTAHGFISGPPTSRQPSV